ncbi:hypothetical protein QZH41_019356 [Actinostola sp. cb2023]|nr:hypothetical protein QZH41_019356 [Actinostola sp. cb2023]
MIKYQKIAFLTVLVILLEAVWNINAASVTVSNKYLTLHGNAHIKFLEPQERFWAGLSDVRFFHKVMKSNKWSSCKKAQFYIRAVNKNDGQPINSGDYITLAPYTRGKTCRLRCFSSSSSYCNSKVCVGENAFKGNNAFAYSYLTFQIFSRKSVDGVDPVQYGDTVAFRYPYYYTHYWLYFSGSYLYARSCSYSGKYSCAAKNNRFGFQIFKKL